MFHVTILFYFAFCASLGGNQRDLARSKSQKKAQDIERSKSAAEKDGNKGLTLEQRKQRCVIAFACIQAAHHFSSFFFLIF